MPINKIIYGKGRAPRPSEFSEGDIIINVDDAKVYSKTKTNTIFEIGGVGSSFSRMNFTGASRSFFINPSSTGAINFKAGTGIDISQEEDTDNILIEATGEAVNEVNAEDIVGTIGLSQIDLIAGNGISLAGGIINVRAGANISLTGGQVSVADAFIKNNANDESTGTITAANIHSNGIVKLAAQSTPPTAVAGGMYFARIFFIICI
jgi:hypothetical protein